MANFLRGIYTTYSETSGGPWWHTFRRDICKVLRGEWGALVAMFLGGVFAEYSGASRGRVVAIFSGVLLQITQVPVGGWVVNFLACFFAKYSGASGGLGGDLFGGFVAKQSVTSEGPRWSNLSRKIVAVETEGRKGKGRIQRTKRTNKLR